MNSTEAIEYIHSLEKFGIKPGLETIGALCAALGNPQDKLKIIHVAGTNGKGSTSTMISNILIKSGYNVGLYISPYVSDFRERIQRNGEMIEKSRLAECVEKVKNAIETELLPRGIQPTEFEALTAAAFVYYELSNCDFVVLEVGLGGRFDATNIIKSALVSVIVSISLDHTAILGDTVEKIAFEKCGIIKKDGVTVTYPLQKAGALSVIEQRCKEENNPLIIPDTEKLEFISEEFDGTTAGYNGLRFKLPLAGKHMIYNACTAIEAVKALEKYGIRVSDEAMINGIAASSMPARLELIKRKPVVILDGGHNEGCGEALAAYIDTYFAKKRIVMVSSMMADKDFDAFLEKAASRADVFFAARANVPRALSSAELKVAAGKYCKNCIDIPSPSEAVKAGYAETGENDVLIVCGSFYLAGEIREDLIKF